jgi:hypothetical protein
MGTFWNKFSSYDTVTGISYQIDANRELIPVFFFVS